MPKEIPVFFQCTSQNQAFNTIIHPIVKTNMPALLYHELFLECCFCEGYTDTSQLLLKCN